MHTAEIHIYAQGNFYIIKLRIFAMYIQFGVLI